MEHSGPTPAQLITDDTLLRSLLAGSYQPLSDDALHRAADEANQGYGAARVAVLEAENARWQELWAAERAFWRAHYQAKIARLEAGNAELHQTIGILTAELLDKATPTAPTPPPHFPATALRHSA